MTELSFASARTIANLIRRKQLSSLEVVDHFLARIAQHNPALNAVVTLDAEQARAAARQADAALASGQALGPLHGVPMTIKDAFEVAGMRTTSGATTWKDHVSSQDAVAVQRLRAAGAIIMGKTNTPAFCADWQSFNAVFGTTNNPWDLSRTPGGSSGGAAAALAAGMTPIEFGSDIAGSVRIPPGFCGVFGHKSSFGLVPPRGHMPGPSGTLAAADLVTVGPMARWADDLALMLDVVAGPLPEDAKAYRLQLPGPRAMTLRGYRVAAWLDDPAFPVDHSVGACLQHAVDELRRAGVQVDDAHPPFELKDAHAMYRSLIDPVMVAGVKREVIASLEASAASADLTDPRAVFARNALIRHSHWMVWNEFRHRQRAQLARFFEDYDVLLCPITPVVAFPHDHSQPQEARRLTVNGQERPYHDLMGWISFSTSCYLPVTSTPVGRTPAGLPVGMQVIAPFLEDRTAIDFAGRLHELLGGFVKPANF
jgi:amidase